MSRARPALSWIGFVSISAAICRGQAPQTTSQALRPEQAIIAALAADPTTAAYRFSAETRPDRLILRGRVGTKVVHDAAVRIAMQVDPRIDDRLVIDTAEAVRAAGPVAGPVPRGYSYLYPPPLFGRWDDPFFGLEPPAIAYPPWWGAMTARRGAEAAPADADPAQPAAAPAASLPPGTVEMTIDPRGVAVLRGTVSSLDERIAVGQRIAASPGVSEVINLLTVRAATPAGGGATPAGGGATPPPPPVPADEVTPPADRGPGIDPGASPVPRPVGARRAAPVDPLADRVLRAFERRPALAGAPIRVTVRDGIVTLSGRVAGALEAMLAYRAAEQTPGVREVVDRLEFTVPDGPRKNPLIETGRPEDVEPYLLAQIRRQVGDQAHIDRVAVRGDSLEVRGTLPRDAVRPRVEAILRSMPLLRGFRISPTWLPE